MAGNIIYTVPWVGGTGNIGYPSSNGSGPYEGGLYIDNGGIDDNYYGMHLDGDSYGYIDPDKLPNGMQPLNIMAYAAGGVAGDEVVVTFSDPKSRITLGKTYANIVFDDNRAVCALFDELSDSGNPQFKQNCSFISDYLFKSLHQTKTVTITTNEFERPIGERFDFMITADRYYNSTHKRIYYGYIASDDNQSGGAQRGDIDIDEILGYKIKLLALMRSDDTYYVMIHTDSALVSSNQITIMFNQNPMLIGSPSSSFAPIREEGNASFLSMQASRNGMMMPCSIYVVGQYTLSVELSNGILGMSGANTEGNLSPLELEGFTINYFGYRYSNDNAWIQFKDSDNKAFSKIYFEMEGVIFCAEKVSESSFYIFDKKNEFKAILEAHKEADITFPMYVPKVFFTKQPQDQDVLDGGDYTVSFGVERSDAIEWWFRASSSADWILLDGENAQTITRTATSISDGNQYKARVSFDGSFAFSEIATVTLKKPDFVFVPENLNLSAGLAYGFKISSVGTIVPTTNNWQPKGNVEFIDAYNNGRGDYYFRFRGVDLDKWNGFDSIDLIAISTNGDKFTITNAKYGNGYTAHEDQDQARGWFAFIQSNEGNEIEVYITENKST
ncbi:hypothetical protein WAX87_11200 [Photobacterium damselae subsp. damselae]|uniref:hypothetical protein n=1 Tax=Photobacterium damselae TaxID=38293 RepID=UPI00311AC0FD